jgi:hypothetical protein
MPQATLTYNLGEHDEKIAFERSAKALDLCAVLSDMDQEFRRKLKYEELSDEVYTNVENLREFLHSSLAEHGVDLDRLYF